ncbi:hypothetical protein K3495_g10110 [Podosphaera aphanis]|nr:hypothetical protein K3495_g10110 [Podosphaera aphanis]
MDIPLPQTNPTVPEEYFWLPPISSNSTITPQLLQESESWRPPSSLCSTPPDVQMVNTRPDRNNISPPQNLQKSSFEKSLIDHIAAEVQNFHKRVAQAKLVLSRFYILLDDIDVVEIRRYTEITATGLRDQITNILSGRATNQTLDSRPPIPQRSDRNKAQKTAPAVPQVSGAHSQRRPTGTQPPSQPLAEGRADFQSYPSLAQKTAPSTMSGLPLTEVPWTKVSRRKPTKATLAHVAQSARTELPQTQPAPKAKKLPAPRPDERLFLRIREGHPWRSMSSCFVKLSLAAKHRVANSAIQQVPVVNSGFAITVANEAARNRLLEEVRRLQREENEVEGAPKEDLKLKAASMWTSVLAPNVPNYL